MNYKPVGLLLFAACAALAQDRVVEVASIRPTQFANEDFYRTYSQQSLCHLPALRIAGNRVEIPAISICGLIRAAYGLQEYNITGVPKALEGTVMLNFFAIQAQAEGDGTLTQEDVRGLLREMLSERFQLKFHKETRELAVYGLYIGKNGAKMPITDAENCDVVSTITAAAARGLRTMGNCRAIETMPGFAEALMLYGMDRPVVDRTGLEGKYRVQLEWARNENSNGPSLFTAIQEQLGLKLEAEKAPVEVLVVDQVTRPTEN